MKVAFEVAVAFIVLAVAVFIAAAIWNAAHDDGLVIEAFQVPPVFADRRDEILNYLEPITF